MKKKNIILSGSEGIIGNSFRMYAENAGHNVFCLDIKSIKRKNYFKCNILSEKEVKKTIKKINFINVPDVLINNASINPKSEEGLKKFKFTSYKYEEWKRNISVDLHGSFLLSKHVLKVFEKEKKGNIINISSIYGLIGPDQDIYGLRKKYYGSKPLEYSVAKSGIIGFTKALAAFYKNTNIKVNCLILGGVENNQNKSFIKKYSSKTIINRMAKVGEYNKYLEFLSSDINSYTTGSIIVVDGGATSIF